MTRKGLIGFNRPIESNIRRNNDLKTT